MKWDENGIAVCESRATVSNLNLRLMVNRGSFYRAAVPKDIDEGRPEPAGWGQPSAILRPEGCDPLKYFVNHSIIFGKSSVMILICIILITTFLDITFCGMLSDTR